MHPRYLLAQSIASLFQMPFLLPIPREKVLPRAKVGMRGRAGELRRAWKLEGLCILETLNLKLLFTAFPLDTFPLIG